MQPVHALPGAPPHRYGWCCLYVPPDGDAAAAKRMNPGTVTVTTLAKLGPARAVEKLLEVLRHNMRALHLQLAELGGQPRHRRMLRINSGLLPAYTHPVAWPLYREPEVRAVVEQGLAHAGAKATAADIRLGFHPDQFCVLNSATPATVDSTVAELEYHAEMLRLMGLAGGWHPRGAHINIHGGARAQGTEAFLAGFARLSRDARDLLTVENDEVSFGLDDLLPLAPHLPLILDIHHHWIRTGGEYIRPDDPRIAVVRDSWRGVRPVAHVSVSREELLAGWPADRLPDFAELAARGLKPRDLRAHSDRMWNRALNALVAGHLSWADFEVEAKAKNLAVDDLDRDAGGGA